MLLPKIILLCAAATTTPIFAEPPKIKSVVGWPHLPLSEDKAPLWLGDDPVIGRLSCPPFSRLNLKTHSAEGIIFKSVEIAKDSHGAVVWRYKLRTGLSWWDGEPVRSEHVANFFRDEIKTAVEENGSGLWALPSFNIETTADSLNIHWQAVPPFGPFVLNGRPFAKPLATPTPGMLAYQCAGHYQLRKEEAGLRLTPSPHYLPAGTAQLFFEKAPSSGKSIFLQFTMAESITPSYLPDDSELGLKSGPVIDLNWVSAIIWNPTKKPTADPRIRQIFTQLTPRGALVREGAQGLGQLLAGPIFRDHPGYVSSLKLRPFNIEKSCQDFDDLGYSRPVGDTHRYLPDQKVFDLNVGVMTKNAGLIQKVLHDCFSAVGIRLNFIPIADIGSKEFEENKAKLDGILAGLFLPYPDFNYLGYWHSNAKPSEIFWSLSDKGLDSWLERYARSLTEEKPDFAFLRQIYQKVYEIEPMSIIMQHRVSLDRKIGAGPNIRQINDKDPDWFRQIVSG